MINNLQGAIMIDGLTQEHETADPNDAWLLALAERSHAEYLVTGDKRAGLLSRRRLGSTHILTAAAFCSDILKKGR